MPGLRRHCYEIVRKRELHQQRDKFVLNTPIKILFENDSWIVLEKPPGISSHGAHPGDLGLVELFDLHDNLKIHLISRLDKETSGVMICAKNPAASAIAQQIHESQESVKTYSLVAEVSKERPPDEFIIETDLDGKSARTEFKVIEHWGTEYLLLEAKIRAGKKHQIRRHAAQAGLPILGDTEYGHSRADRLYLHCTQLQWPNIAPVKSPLPESFRALRSAMQTNAMGQSQFLEQLNISLAAAVERRGHFLDNRSAAWRAVHRFECPGDFAIDIYGSNLCAWLYEEDSREALLHCLESLCTSYGLSGGVIKSSLKNPHKMGRLCETEVFGHPPLEDFLISEGPLNFNVNLLANEQTGFFADQRDNRSRVRKIANGKDVANLFSYTCSFSVAASIGGCHSVISVDNSHSALGQGMENFKVNQCDGRPGTKFAKDDVRAWLRRQERKGIRFDLIICDPPTFGSGSKKQTPFRLAEEWPALAESVSTLLNRGGEALFCTNSRTLETIWLEKILRENFSEVLRQRTPLDFPERVDERHNRFFWCKK